MLLGFSLVLWWIINQFKKTRDMLQQTLLSQLSDGRQQQLQQLADMQHTLSQRINDLQSNQERRIGELSMQLSEKLSSSNVVLQQGLNKNRESFDARQLEALKTQQQNLTQGMGEVRKQVTEALTLNGNELGKKVDALTRSTDERLKEISGQVDKRLNEGFEKTTATFADVVKRLALIDEAQKKITELSGNDHLRKRAEWAP